MFMKTIWYNRYIMAQRRIYGEGGDSEDLDPPQTLIYVPQIYRYNMLDNYF